MKRFNYISLSFLTVLISFSSCKDYLEKPLITDRVTKEEIFSSRQNAESFLWETYKESIPYGWPLYEQGWVDRIPRDILGSFCDETNYSIGYSVSTNANIAGYDPSNRRYMPDVYKLNWVGIRKAWIFIENIDEVSGIPPLEKEQMKAEAKCLIALRYLYMLGFYGGVPIVKKSYNIDDSFKIKRASIVEMIDYIVSLCDSAAAVLPNHYPDRWRGRVTKGVALAVKARTLLYAASPWFNSDNPVIDFGENDSLISYGNYNKERWKAAIDANKAVIDWAKGNGCHIIDTGNPFDDYGRAVSEQDNPEVILAYQAEIHSNGWTRYYLPTLGNFNQGNVITYNILPVFHKADGSDQDWPTIEDGPHPFSEYQAKMNEMEPRFKQVAWIWGSNTWTSPGVPRFRWKVDKVPGDVEIKAGTAIMIKGTYEYKGGDDPNYAPDWIVFRLAEFYLNYAEAVNEFSPNDVRAYDALNVIRKRAGLPEVNPSDPKYNTQDKLRKLIWRERAVELFGEGHRYFDVRRWRIAQNPGIIGGSFYGFKYQRNSNHSGYLTYEVFLQEDRKWTKAMYFAPFPVEDVNKGLRQNPGY